MPILEGEKRIPRKHYLAFQGGTHLTPPWAIKHAPAISANELLGVTLDEQKVDKLGPYRKDELADFSLTTRPIHFITITGQESDAIEYIGIVEVQLGGKLFNQLALSIAPDKTAFGLDTADMILDWGRVDNPQYKGIIDKHAKGLGLAWRIFGRDRRFFTGQLERWQSAPWLKAESLNQFSMVPLMHWVDMGGRRRWMFNYLTKPPYQQLREDYLDKLFPDTIYKSSYPRRLNPTAGLYTAFHFSPDVTEAWPSRDALTPGGNPRAIGTTQVVVYAIDKTYQLFAGSFIKASENYAREFSLGG